MTASAPLLASSGRRVCLGSAPEWCVSAIFISHSSADATVADELARRLEAEGHRSVFLDFDPERGIPAGRNWERELYDQLRSCQAMVVLCSKASMASKWCFAEVIHARRSVADHDRTRPVEPGERDG